MINKSELKILDSFAYILECIAEECFGDAKGAISDLILYVKKYAEIPSELRKEIIQTLEKSFVERETSGYRAMAVCLSRMNRKLWLTAKKRLPRTIREPFDDPEELRQIVRTLNVAVHTEIVTAMLPKNEFYDVRVHLGNVWPSLSSAMDPIQEISAAIRPTLLHLFEKHKRILKELQTQTTQN